MVALLGKFARPSAWLLALLAGTSDAASNVDLSTVPNRDAVELTIYNSEDLTLVRETRQVSFKKGINPLQFSWAGTQIDPTSVELRFLTDPDKLDVLDTTLPHQRSQTLYWNVQSEIEGQATVEIVYFTSGITWSADYVCIADADESQLSLEGFIRVYNGSGERYENAHLRLIVGTINLVEKIAQLAGVPVEQLVKLDDSFMHTLKRDRAKDVFDKLPRFSGGALGQLNEGAVDEKKIIKEGLSEYFIYNIEGTETIENGWSKRMRSFAAQQVPFKIQYRYRPAEYGEQLARLYLLSNDEKCKLGTTPLPDGTVRIFRKAGHNGMSFLAAQPTKYIPIGDKIELNLGHDPRVTFDLANQRHWRDNFWLQVQGTNTFRKVGSGKMELDERSTVAGWDEHALFTQRIHNTSDRMIDVEIRRTIPGQAVFRSALDPRLHDYQTVEYHTAVMPRQTARLKYEVVTSQGRNAKQHHVSLERTDVKD